MLHKPALPRIDTVEVTPDLLRRIFIALAESCVANDETSLSLIYHFAEEEDEFEVGQFVPEMIFQVRKIVAPEEEDGK